MPVRASCGVMAAFMAPVAAHPYRRDCDNFPEAGFSAMGGVWTQNPDSGLITTVSNVVTVDLTGVSETPGGVFVQTTAGTPTSTSFTETLTGDGCSTNPNVVASTESESATLFASPLEIVVTGLSEADCDSVTVYVGTSTRYEPGIIYSRTMSLCDGSVVTAAPTTTSQTTTTQTNIETTTQVVAGDGGSTSEFDAFQFTAEYGESGEFNVYWYVIDDAINIFWTTDFGDDSSNKYAAIGLSESAGNGMGPGQFYVGSTVDLSVEPRELTSSGSARPSTVVDPTVRDSGCELTDGRLTCFVMRDLDGSGTSVNPNLNEETNLLWAVGDVSSGDINQHTNRGRGETINLVDTSPVLPSLTIPDQLWVQWSPTPLDTLNVYMTATTNDADSWVGVGFGLEGDSMGPAQFFTGQTSNGVTDRYSSGFARPEPREDSDVVDSSCSYATTTGNLTCSFTRPLVGSGENSIRLDADASQSEVFCRFAWGLLSSGDISQHLGGDTNRGLSEAAIAFFSVDAGAIGVGDSSPALFQAHAIIMAIAWLFLLPFGIFVARFRDISGMGKKGEAPPLWFQIHQPAQYIGVILMIIAIIIIFVQAGPMTPEYLASTFSGGAHQIVGIISFALTLCQPFFAFFRNGCCETDEEKKNKCHDAWHVIHAITGYLALILALVAVGMGMQEYNLGADWPVLWSVGFWISILSMIVFSIVAIVLMLVQAKTKSKHTTDEETGKTDGHGSDDAGGYAFLPWLLFVLLLVGAVLCAVAVGLDESR